MPTGIYERKLKSREQSKMCQEQAHMIGQKFDRLLVISYDEETSKQKRHDWYLCRCDCGVKKAVSGGRLRRGHTRSCGCLMREIARKFCSQVGENHPGYLHGLKSGLRKFRKIVRERDKVCQYHDGEHEGRFESHHLDGDKYNHDPKNGALLCMKHHHVVTKNDNVWRPGC